MSPVVHAGLSLEAAQALVAAALSLAQRDGLKPLAVVVLDARGAVKAAAAQDGTSLKRFEVAHAKAFGALALGMGSRSIAKRALTQPHFVAAASHVIGGSLIPVPGGVLVLDRDQVVIGAAGASGDTSENDERAVMAGIEAAGCFGDPGTDS